MICHEVCSMKEINNGNQELQNHHVMILEKNENPIIMEDLGHKRDDEKYEVRTKRRLSENIEGCSMLYGSMVSLQCF